MAKKFQWQRPEHCKPGRKPEAKSRTLVTRRELPGETKPSSSLSPAVAELAEVDPAVLVQKTLVTLDLLHDMLREEMRNRGWLEDVIEEETDGDKSPRRREAMLKAISMPTLVMASKNLSGAIKTLQEAAPGKKEQAQNEAERIAAGDSDWGSDLGAPGDLN